MLFPEFDLDDLAVLWTAGCLLAFIVITAWPLRTAAGRAAEMQRFERDPLAYLLLLGAIASTLAFLAWIASSGRVFGIWMLPTALIFGALAYLRIR